MIMIAFHKKKIVCKPYCISGWDDDLYDGNGDDDDVPRRRLEGTLLEIPYSPIKSIYSWSNPDVKNTPIAATAAWQCGINGLYTESYIIPCRTMKCQMLLTCYKV